jgi:hypothetical protein
VSGSTTGQIAAAALDWAASGNPRPPEEIAGLSTADQVLLFREADKVVRAVEDKITGQSPDDLR